MTIHDQLEKIRKRQTARLLGHLEQTGQITPLLRCSVMRAMCYVFGDVADAVAGAAGERIPDRELDAEWRPGQ
jgi:hypothetical protein